MADLYALEPDLPAPALPGHVVLRDNKEEVLDALAAELMLHAQVCVREFGDYHMVLSAGRDAESLCIKLMTDPAFRAIPWRDTHLWFATEAAVPDDDPRSTAGRVTGFLEGHAGIPRSSIHRVNAGAEGAAGAYHKELERALRKRDKGQRRPDFVLITLDPAETTPAEALWRSGSDPRGQDFSDVDRNPRGVSLTASLVSRTRYVALVGTGETCRGAVAGSVLGTPGAAIWDRARPVAGELRWFIDHAAHPDGAGHPPTTESEA